MESDSQARFETELEFLQCLAAPAYLHFLAQNQYFEDKRFIAYLKYLQYWKRPEYAKFVMFPHALYFLDLLQREEFRKALRSPDYALLLHQQQGFHWQYASSTAFRPRAPGEPLPTLANQPAVPQQSQSAAPSPDGPGPSPSPDMDTPAHTPAHTPGTV